MKIQRLLSVFAVASLAALSACGGGSEGSSGKTALIGVAESLTGPAASNGQAGKCGLQAYFDTFNAKGGVNGYKVKLMIRDTQYDPVRSASIAQEFARAKVLAAEVSGTPQSKAAIAVLKPRGIPVFGSAAGNVLNGTGNLSFSTQFDYQRLGALGADYIMSQLGVKDFGLAYLAGEPGQPIADTLPAYVGKKGGSVVESIPITLTATDYAPYVQSLKASGAKAVFTPLLDVQLSALQKAADAIGYKPAWVSWPAANTSTYQKLAGGLADDTYFVLTIEPVTDEPKTEAQKEFVTAVKKECPDLLQSYNVASTWGAAAAIARGIENATKNGGKLTPATLAKGAEGTDVDLGMQTVTWKGENRSGVSQAGVYQLKGGSFTQVQDFQPLPPLK